MYAKCSASSFCLGLGNVKIVLNNPNPTRSLNLLAGKDVYFNVSILTLFPGGEGYSQKNWVEVCGPLLRTLTLFITKICEIPYPIYDLTKNSKPYL